MIGSDQQIIKNDESYVIVEPPFAKVLSDSDSDTKLRCHILQLQELTNCTEDQAITALYDCENNIERAVELVLDKFRCGVDEEWHITVNKKVKHKNVNSGEVVKKVNGPYVKKGSVKQKFFPSKPVDEIVTTNDSAGLQRSDNQTVQAKRVVNRNKKTNVKQKDVANEKNKGRGQLNRKVYDVVNIVGDSPKKKTESDVDVWDSCIDCGIWEGESIEIINSNVSIALGLQEADISTESQSDLDDKHKNKDNIYESQACDDHVRFLAHSIDAEDSDSLFTTVAKSRPPPRAFDGIVDALFIAPEILKNIDSKWKHTFGCDALLSSFAQDFVKHSNRMNNDVIDNLSNHVDQVKQVTNDLSDYNSNKFPYTSQIPLSTNSNGFENKSASALNVLIDSKMEDKIKSISDYTSRHFEDNTVAPTSFSDIHKQNVSMTTSNSSSQTTYIEPVIKNYLEGLSENINKLNVSEGVNHNQKSAHFVMHQQSQTPTQISFSHSQSLNTAPIQQHSLSKLQMHSTTNGSNFSQPITSSNQLHSQQPTTLPPGMPHFISQFAPPTYHMFNLPGNSNAGPTVLDFDHLQILQQQRLLYDIHLQHHSVTTSQNMLVSNNDTSNSGKTVNHMSGHLGHVTAASSAMRPDMLTPTIGHSPQMMAPSYPYFPHPGWVLMNGYPNAFLNQQQQQQVSSDQNPGLCGSPLQQQQQHQQVNQSQNYGNMKQLNNNVNNYEDFLELNYGDASKQVGFKSNSNQLNYASFQSQNIPVDGVGNKLSANHPGGPLAQNFNHNNSNSHFPTQYYQSCAPTAAASPYLTAVAAAAVAAASVKQASNNMVANAPGAVGNQSSGIGTCSSQLHMPGNPALSGLALGGSGSGLHHHHQQQRPAIPH